MAGYLGNVPVPQATQTRDRFVATSGQTTFATSGYTVGYLDVYLNGVKLDSTDYTATNGSDVVLSVGAVADDVVEVTAYSTFEIGSNVDNASVTTGTLTVDGGDVSFYEDTGTTAKFFWDASAERLGIGTTTPSGELHVKGSGHVDLFIQSSDSNASKSTIMFGDTDSSTVGRVSYDHNIDALDINTNGANRMRIDANGQVGISHTPSSSVSADTKNLFVGGLTCIRGTTGTSGKQNFNNGIQFNAYPTGSQSDNAIVSSSANDFLPLKYSQNNGVHRFFGSTSATAGSAISWNEYMKIDQAGRVTMPYQPAFDVKSANNTGDLVWTEVSSNVGNHYNTSTGYFTAPIAGHYLFTMTVGTNSTFGADIKKNGAVYRRVENTNIGGFFWSTTSVVMYLTANDIVNCGVFTGSPSTNGPYGGFSGYLIG